MRALVLIMVLFGYHAAQSQDMDSLRRQVLALELKTQELDLRMDRSRRQFQTGILVSTLGYSITIAGGLMLGRENDQLGQVLLVAGGATGITGTYLLVDAFNILGGRKRRKSDPR